MGAAALISVGTSIMTCVSTLPRFQTGYHIWDLRPELAANPVQTAQVGEHETCKYSDSSDFCR